MTTIAQKYKRFGVEYFQNSPYGRLNKIEDRDISLGWEGMKPLILAELSLSQESFFMNQSDSDDQENQDEKFVEMAKKALDELDA